MIELDDCGREQHLTFGKRITHQANVVVIMVVKSPKGTLALFKDGDLIQQCEVIKAFMKEHRNE